MTDYLTALLGFFFNEENQFLIMLASSFLSSTLLPGNSEIIFSTFTSQALLVKPTLFSYTLCGLLFTATVGNSLGSLTTYFLAQFFPPPKLHEKQGKSVQLAFKFSEKYGVWVLLFSWLPVVGDLFCGIAGWLRFNLWHSLLLIVIGKAIRYGLLLWSVYLVVA
ncbi:MULTISPECIES: YqaA family protein [Glaesserella]|uniref:DedA family protein n=1 Tax=Glaesserella australis TaxID=2094024 RepID=A0A328C0M8_9PAST|nr:MULTISPECIES: YqaA family protein [Glaesserella]AUI66375.1 hypothetical protein CJD39_07170 [Glaesserella sp. 15-184]RAL19411.1 hypothetical protein C5N92_02900 [Glaesserella australis]